MVRSLVDRTFQLRYLGERLGDRGRGNLRRGAAFLRQPHRGAGDPALEDAHLRRHRRRVGHELRPPGRHRLAAHQLRPREEHRADGALGYAPRRGLKE